MRTSKDGMYEEAVSLWRAFSDEPPPPGDAKAVIEAALSRCSVAGYDKLKSRWLQDPALTWARYQKAPPHLA